MAKFKCRHCGVVTVRNLKDRSTRQYMTKRGYKSYCETAGRNTFLIKIK